jgi:hypothetical protein
MRVRRRAKGSSRRPRALTRGMSVMANRPDPPRPRSVPTVASTRWRRSSSGAFLDKRRIRSENDLPWRWRGWRARWRRGRQRGRVGWWCNGGGCLTGSGRREGEGAGGGRARRGAGSVWENRGVDLFDAVGERTSTRAAAGERRT